MKNIHIIPTEKPSNVHISKRGIKGLFVYTNLHKEDAYTKPQNIYITSDEQGFKGDWVIHTPTNKIIKVVEHIRRADFKKIILTTDLDLIKDGVQAIDDEFLKWFVKNPSCIGIKVEKFHGLKTSIAEISAISGNDDYNWKGRGDFRDYKIIIPKEEFNYNMKQEILAEMERLQKEEPKQETLEEAAEVFFDAYSNDEYKKGLVQGFCFGAKWQAKQLYSEEDLMEAYMEGGNDESVYKTFYEWFEQFKKK
jgi:hypothetical protein